MGEELVSHKGSIKSKGSIKGSKHDSKGSKHESKGSKPDSKGSKPDSKGSNQFEMAKQRTRAETINP